MNMIKLKCGITDEYGFSIKNAELYIDDEGIKINCSIAEYSLSVNYDEITKAFTMLGRMKVYYLNDQSFIIISRFQKSRIVSALVKHNIPVVHRPFL